MFLVERAAYGSRDTPEGYATASPAVSALSASSPSSSASPPREDGNTAVPPKIKKYTWIRDIESSFRSQIAKTILSPKAINGYITIACILLAAAFTVAIVLCGGPLFAMLAGLIFGATAAALTVTTVASAGVFFGVCFGLLKALFKVISVRMLSNDYQDKLSKKSFEAIREYTLRCYKEYLRKIKKDLEELETIPANGLSPQEAARVKKELQDEKLETVLLANGLSPKEAAEVRKQLPYIATVTLKDAVLEILPGVNPTFRPHMKKYNQVSQMFSLLKSNRDSYSDLQEFLSLYHSISKIQLLDSTNPDHFLCWFREVSHVYMRGVDGSEVYQQLGAEKLRGKAAPQSVEEYADFMKDALPTAFQSTSLNPFHLLESLREKLLGLYYNDAQERGNIPTAGQSFENNGVTVQLVEAPGTFDTSREAVLASTSEDQLIFNLQSERGAEGKRTEFYQNYVDGVKSVNGGTITVVTLPQIGDFMKNKTKPATVGGYLTEYAKFLKEKRLDGEIVDEAIRRVKIAFEGATDELDADFGRMLEAEARNYFMLLTIDQYTLKRKAEKKEKVFVQIVCKEMLDRGPSAEKGVLFLQSIREAGMNVVDKTPIFDPIQMARNIGELFRANVVRGRDPKRHHLKPLADFVRYSSKHMDRVALSLASSH
jgi:hypothetical protein